MWTKPIIQRNDGKVIKTFSLASYFLFFPSAKFAFQKDKRKSIITKLVGYLLQHDDTWICIHDFSWIQCCCKVSIHLFLILTSNPSNNSLILRFGVYIFVRLKNIYIYIYIYFFFLFLIIFNIKIKVETVMTGYFMPR